MFCKQCGMPLEDNSTMCPKCGIPVGEVAADLSTVRLRMTFVEAISNFFTKENFSTNGRSSRAEFWYTYLFLFIVDLVALVLGGKPAGMAMLKFACILGLFICVRRIHDAGKPGWCVLVPIYNIVLFCMPGEPKDNKFGPQPQVGSRQSYLGARQYQYSFCEAIKKIFTQTNFSMRGRASRSEFWWMYLFLCCVCMVISIVVGDAAGHAVEWLAFVLMIFPAIRRIHDVGRSGWFGLIPIYNIVLLCLASESKDNQFGQIPNLQPIPKSVPSLKIMFGVGAAAVIAMVAGACFGGDSPKAAFNRFVESIEEKNAEKFFSSVYLEDMNSNIIAVDRDACDKIFEKFERENLDDEMRKLMSKPEILGVVEDDEGTYVKFAPNDEGLRAQWVAGGVSGMMVMVVKTDEGWKVRFDRMRPVFASAEKGTSASAREEELKLSQAFNDLRTAVAKGRKLHSTIFEANVNRETCGLTSVWPHLTEDDGLSDDKGDISGLRFARATDYFSVLFDVEHIKCGDWSPYVSGVGLDVLSLDGKEFKSGFLYKDNVGWMVVAGVTDEMDDNFPILVSANIEPSYLTFNKGVKDVDIDVRKIPVGVEAGRIGNASWWNEAVVVVRKGGGTDVIPREKCTMRALFKTRVVEVPGSAGVKCLEP